MAAVGQQPRRIRGAHTRRISALTRAVFFEKLGVEVNGVYRQMNAKHLADEKRVLQFHPSQNRVGVHQPKRPTKRGHRDAGGVGRAGGYVEVRAIEVKRVRHGGRDQNSFFFFLRSSKFYQRAVPDVRTPPPIEFERKPR